MDEYYFKLTSLSTFNIANDPVINAFRALSSDDSAVAFGAYGVICKSLFSANQNLSEYLHNVLIYCDDSLLEQYINTKNEALLKAIEFDIAIISDLAKCSAKTIKKDLSTKFEEEFAQTLPEYLNGVFNYDAAYFIDFFVKNGSGIFAKYKVFVLDGGSLVPVLSPDNISLYDLKDYEVQRNQVINNTLCFLNHQPAANALLYGERGTGKSSTVKAIANEYKELRIIGIDKKQISELDTIFKLVYKSLLKFIIFIDDLTFSENDDDFNYLKQVLDGSLSVQPANTLIYATTNRRHIIKENSNAERVADEVDDNMSLADRFGLYVTFMSPSKTVYLDIVKKLAVDKKVLIDDETLFKGAERYALKRSGRSPRIAKQYVEMVASHIATGLTL